MLMRVFQKRHKVTAISAHIQANTSANIVCYKTYILIFNYLHSATLGRI